MNESEARKAAGVCAYWVAATAIPSAPIPIATNLCCLNRSDTNT